MVETDTTTLPAYTKSWQSGVLDLSDGYLAYHRAGGPGPVIVFCHGLTDNGLCWGPTAQALENGFDVVMLDARGHGKSARMSTDVPPNPARDLGEAIAALGLQEPILMGHSVGARAVAAFASENPDWASKLILEDPPLLPLTNSPGALDQLEKFQAHIKTLQTMPISKIVAIGQKQSPNWHDDEFPAWALSKQQVDPHALDIRSSPWESAFAKIPKPTLLIHGEAHLGSMVATEAAAQASQINPLIRSCLVKGAGHNVRRENFGGFIEAVRAFLDET